jgi:hypothetical protein
MQGFGGQTRGKEPLIRPRLWLGLSEIRLEIWSGLIWLRVGTDLRLC